MVVNFQGGLTSFFWGGRFSFKGLGFILGGVEIELECLKLFQ